jgi:hypothetical protein
MDAINLANFLPGRFWFARGCAQDYRGLERFHYLKKSPATWAGVWVVRYDESGGGSGAAPGQSTNHGPWLPASSRIVAAAVLSYPTVNSAARDDVLHLQAWEKQRRLRFVNAHVRAISRVVVHPQFRSLGLAAALVRRICEDCTVRYVEAFAVMGRVHPFFEKGGMKRVSQREDGPVYYLHERVEPTFPGGMGNGTPLPVRFPEMRDTGKRVHLPMPPMPPNHHNAND